jgi:hypothetical protein
MQFTWNVVQMDRKSADGFVTTVHYAVNAVDGENKDLSTEGQYIASTYGSVQFIEEDKSYIPFANLTKEQVIGWVKDLLGQDTVEQSLAAQIDALKNPASESGLPWAE